MSKYAVILGDDDESYGRRVLGFDTEAEATQALEKIAAHAAAMDEKDEFSYLAMAYEQGPWEVVPLEDVDDVIAQDIAEAKKMADGTAYPPFYIGEPPNLVVDVGGSRSLHIFYWDGRTYVIYPEQAPRGLMSQTIVQRGFNNIAYEGQIRWIRTYSWHVAAEPAINDYYESKAFLASIQ